MEKRITLVLGGGTARELAHIGVIRVLEEEGFRVSAISGASMGALVGGIYAAGKLDDYVPWVRSLTKRDSLRYLDVSLGGSSGILKGDLIIEALRGLVGDVAIEDLPIPFIAVATDLTARKEVVAHERQFIRGDPGRHRHSGRAYPATAGRSLAG